LGVWEIFISDQNVPSPAILSCWGRNEPYEYDFIFNPYGNGWHVDRRRFDEMLATAAEKRGARVYRKARARSCCQNPSGHWMIEAEFAKSFSHLEATCVVDATGRASWLTHRLGARRLVWDRLVALLGYGPVSLAWRGDGRMWLESQEEGWWYSALLPEQRVVLAYMTDADQLAVKAKDLERFLREGLKCTALTGRRLSDRQVSNVRLVSANSYSMDRVAGRNWLAAGDAAMAWDPLSGRGITKALESGMRAAETIVKTLNGDTAAPDEYQKWIDAQFIDYLRTYRQYYGAEQRWPHSPFWQRRQRPLPITSRELPFKSTVGVRTSAEGTSQKSAQEILP
jgi:flavin-dependent dehydrogenase